MKEYDVIVIGAGSGGLVAATSAHRKGLKTAMIEKNKIGGECTHYGCVPSKALINTAKTYHSFDTMSDLGIEAKKPAVHFDKIMEGVDAIVQGIYAHETPDVFEKMGIDVYVDNSGAQFQDANTITIGKETLKATYFVICTGSSPKTLPIEGVEKVSVYENENFWEVREKPESIVFIGGGVISVELGQALNRLGSKVTIMDRNPRILKVTEEEVGSYLSEVLQKEGVHLLTGASPLRFKDSKTLVYQKNDEEKEIQTDHFFMATGRSANTAGMQLEKAGVDFSEKGVTTNDYLQTSAAHIYACGDVTTSFKFTHTASHQANICVDNILKEMSKKNDLSILPWAIFTEPEIGHVGLTETVARAQYGDENISVFKVDAAIDRFITDGKTGGLLKVIFNSSDLVVGAEAVGAHAGEWIQILTLAIKNKIPAAQMADTIFAYPTYSEIVKKAFSRYLRTK